MRISVRATSSFLAGALAALVLLNVPVDAGTPPVLVFDRWLDPDSGTELARLPRALRGEHPAPAIPTADGRFRCGEGCIADPATLWATTIPGEVRTHRVAVDTLIRLDVDGRPMWRAVLPGRVSDQPGEWGSRDQILYMSYEGGVAAVDERNGALVWHVRGLRGPVVVHRELVLATAVSGPAHTQKNEVVALLAESGRETWRATLAIERDLHTKWFRAGPLVGITQRSPVYFNPFLALLDAKGQVVWSVAETMVSTIPMKDGALIHTAHMGEDFVARGTLRWLDGKGHVVWRKDDDRYWSDAGMSRVSGGDVLVLSYSRIADSGVYVERVDARTGETVWAALCKKLDVSHDAYFHEAYAVERGRSVVVVSQGAYGWFVEVLSRDKGLRLHRWARLGAEY